MQRLTEPARHFGPLGDEVGVAVIGAGYWGPNLIRNFLACDDIAAGNLGEIQNVDSVRINLGIVQHDTNVFWDLLPHDLSIFDAVLPAGSVPYAVSALGVDPIGAGQICVGHVTMLLPGDAI